MHVLYTDSTEMSAEWIFNGSPCIKSVKGEIDRFLCSLRSTSHNVISSSPVSNTTNFVSGLFMPNAGSPRPLQGQNSYRFTGLQPRFPPSDHQRSVIVPFNAFGAPRRPHFHGFQQMGKQLPLQNQVALNAQKKFIQTRISEPVSSNNLSPTFRDEFSNAQPLNGSNDYMDQFLIDRVESFGFTHVKSTLTPTFLGDGAYSVDNKVLSRSSRSSSQNNFNLNSNDWLSGYNTDENNNDLPIIGSRVQLLKSVLPESTIVYESHELCSPDCLKSKSLKDSYYNESLLLEPIRNGFERVVLAEENFFDEIKVKFYPDNAYEDLVLAYKAPCGRMLRNIEEVADYLAKTEIKLPIDTFAFDCEILDVFENSDLVPCNVVNDDVSKGEEKYAVRAVNDLERNLLPIFRNYILQNKSSPEVEERRSSDPEFLVCCECTDNCRDKLQCACVKLTIESAKGDRYFPEENLAGYDNRKLYDQHYFG